MSVDGKEMISIVNGDAKIIYNYEPAEGKAMKMVYNEEMQTTPTPERIMK